MSFKDISIFICGSHFVWQSENISAMLEDGITGFIYLEDLTWVFMFYGIYKSSWGKEIKCEAFSLFRNEFDKLNNTEARM